VAIVLGSQDLPDSSPDSGQSPSPVPPWKIKLLYDGECPLCVREVNFLTRKDGGRGLVAFVDIAADDYVPAAHGRVTFEAAMGRIHGILPDGTIIRNVEVFRRVYQILGMGWIYAPTQWPLIAPVADALYGIWAAWRLPLTGRPSLQRILDGRRQRLNGETLPEADCGSDRCLR